ncbi:MAG: NAD(P)/FAD-dependent oxidoreductase [Candidatus Aminicenantes bacterium]|nr:NAD(P)/FAD-dependent oxidoreductase [Candidatus Aminicenantes bacterium]
MKIVIVGNGVAGTMAAKAIRDHDPGASITILAAEGHPYYPRPNLIEYVAGGLPRAKLFAFPPGWASGLGIDLRLATPARAIRPESREVEPAAGGALPYDRLLLADGASAAVPPIRGADKGGVFTLRTLDDAEAIVEHVRKRPRVAVVGGGLLGLEIARALQARSAEVEVIEFLPHLLPRQLDPAGGEVLKSQIERRGIRVRVGLATEEILGRTDVEGLRFKDGSEIRVDTAVLAAGVRPNLALARQAGLAVDRGVLVNDRMETSLPGIYAAGDGTQHDGRLYGIIPAAFEQARIAAAAILDREGRYIGTVPSNTLKVAGMALTSVGLVNPEGPGFEELRASNPEAGIYKKIVLRDGALVGAVWLGTKAGVAELVKAVSRKTPAASRKHDLLREDFDFASL